MESGHRKSINWIVILTSNSREFDAACKHVEQISRDRLKGHDGSELPFKVRVGEFEGHSVAVVNSLESGNQRIQSAMHAALYQFKPGLVLLVGVGGGISDEATIGSVVLSSRISDHTYSQEDGKSVSFKLRGGDVDRALILLADEVQEEKFWVNRIKSPVQTPLEQLTKEVIVGPIGAGNVLITDLSSETAVFLKKTGVHTVEMESAGCYDLAQTSKVRFITIRGISDRCSDKDVRTDEYRQPWAAAHASAVAFELIHKFITDSKANVKNVLSNLSNATEVAQIQRTRLLVEDVPLPPRPASRGVLVTQLADHLTEKCCLWLHGPSGLGKTTLALMVARQSKKTFEFVDLRGCAADDAKTRLIDAVSALQLNRAEGLVVDDFPIKHASELLLAIAQLIAVAQRNGKAIIITSSKSPTPEIERRIGEQAFIEFQVPYLTEDDVAELVTEAGGNSSIWAKPIQHFAGGGHPQIVDAKILGLSKRGWSTSELIPLGGESPEVLAQHDSAFQRLINELPPEARRLLCRLSLCLGTFDRELAFALAEVSPSIDLPGEQLQYLIGPWVEARGNDQYVVSPLVKNAGTSNLSKSEQTASRNQVVWNLIARSPFPGEQLMQLFFLSYLEQNAAGLTWFAGLMLQHILDDADFLRMAEQVGMLALFKLDRPLFRGDPFLAALLRITQFFVSATTNWGSPAEIFDCAVEECLALPDKMLSSAMLLTLTVKSLNHRGEVLDARRWVPLIAEFPRLLEETGQLGESLRNMPLRTEEFNGGSDGLGYNSPEEFLFTLEATAMPNVEALVTLFESLDDLTKEKRDHLLGGLDQDFPGTRLMISGPWSRQANLVHLDGYLLADQYERLAKMAATWQHPSIEIQCCCAQAVMLDEYAGDAARATAVLDAAIAKFGATDDLLRRKQVVLFRQGQHEESFKFRPPAVPSIPNDVERIYGLRDAAISASKCGLRQQARQLFEEAATISKQHPNTMPHMPACLIGDSAIIEFDSAKPWNKKRY
jgi:nucleoside phosphorylase/DNA polymerase III delta prime subunit